MCGVLYLPYVIREKAGRYFALGVIRGKAGAPASREVIKSMVPGKTNYRYGYAVGTESERRYRE
jgi:hypothetical protein